MALWLMKVEPDFYGLPQLKKDRTTLWDGVTNPQALGYLRQCAAGDRALYYHTGDEKAVVGVMAVTGPAVPDPAAADPKHVAVPVKFVAALPRPVTLAEIKADPAFAAWALVRNPRLSVMPCPPELWERIEALAAQPAPAKKN